MPMSPHYHEPTDGEHSQHIDWRPLLHMTNQYRRDFETDDTNARKPITLNMVCGLLFNPARTTIALIEKDHPAPMAGKLNGIGGKVRLDETFQQAMEREFEEEAGVALDTWEHFASLIGQRWDNALELYHVQFYRAFDMRMYRTHTMEREPIVRVDLTDLHYQPKVIHLDWLIRMALDERLKVPIEFMSLPEPESNA